MRRILSSKQKGPPHWGGPSNPKPNTLGAELAGFLAISLAGKSLLDALFLAGFQVEGVSFYFLDDILLLYFAFETAQRALQGFALLYDHFSQ